MQAVPLGEREGELELEGEPMQWLCWRFEGSWKIDVDLVTSPSACLSVINFSSIVVITFRYTTRSNRNTYILNFGVSTVHELTGRGMHGDSGIEIRILKLPLVHLEHLWRTAEVTVPIQRMVFMMCTTKMQYHQKFAYCNGAGHTKILINLSQSSTQPEEMIKSPVSPLLKRSMRRHCNSGCTLSSPPQV